MFKQLAVMLTLVALVVPLAAHAQDGPTPAPVTLDPVPYMRVDHAGIRFAFEAALADAVTVAEYPATEGDVQMPSPAYTEFVFEGYADGGDWLRHALTPRISIYTIEDFGPYPFYIEQLDELSRLLAERPDLNRYALAHAGDPDALTLPFLPLFPAAQVFRARPEYVEVANVRGIRYLAYYAQAMNPIAEGEVFYTFQGITDDGQHYVSAILPVNTGVLPSELPAIDDPDAYAEEYRQYLMDVMGHLTTAQPERFTPALSMLDDLVQSIDIRR